MATVGASPRGIDVTGGAGVQSAGYDDYPAPPWNLPVYFGLCSAVLAPTFSPAPMELWSSILSQ
jgi:hypothetical protein